jgi:hypothetical protein
MRQMDKPGRHHAKWNKPRTERQLWPDLTYTWNLKKAKYKKQEVEIWLGRASWEGDFGQKVLSGRVHA